MQTNKTSAELLADLPEADRAVVAEQMAKIEATINQRRSFATWLLWLFEDRRVQERIKEIAANV